MTELYVLRHAHAGDPEAWTGPDAARPLSDKGRRQAERLGRFLADLGFSPDAIISSPKIRASQTAEIVAERLRRQVTLDARLAESVGIDAVAAVLHDAGDPVRPVIVGHDPDFSDLVAALTGAPEVPMRKGALALIDVSGRLAAGAGTLRWLVPPDLLKPAD